MLKTGVIFLDFDGPIFPKKVKMYPQNKGLSSLKQCKKMQLHKDVNYWYADPFAIAILNRLRELSNYQLVITSTWAEDRLHNQTQIKTLLDENGLNYELHKDWKTQEIGKDRQSRIEMWLKNHPEVENNYFIFDDINSAPELFFEKNYMNSIINQRNVYLADVNDGLSYEQLDDMVFLIEKWN